MPKKFKVLTRNLYLGADETPITAAAIAGEEAQVISLATTFWQKVQNTDFAERSKAFASEVVDHKPHLIGIQEAALYRTGALDGREASDVQIDFLQLLVDELGRQGLSYIPVSVRDSFDGQVPAFLGPDELGTLRLTGRDVILMRSDLPARKFRLVGSNQGTYNSQLDVVTGLSASRGWSSVDVMYKDQSLRFVTTHLESDQPEIQEAQADELIGLLTKSNKRTLLVGDFNTDAENRKSPSYSTYRSLKRTPLKDSWTELKPNAPKNKSVTYGENGDLRSEPFSADPQRLDYIFFGYGLTPRSIDRFITPVLGSSSNGPLWNSDHGGLSAEFTFTNKFAKIPSERPYFSWAES